MQPVEGDDAIGEILVAAEDLRRRVRELAAEVSRSQLTGWVLHPGGRDVLLELRDRLDLAEEDVRWSEAVLRETTKRVPLRRLGRPDEIAQGVLSVIENDFFNGKVFELDGGLIV